jgi:hypothetical protein
MTIDFDAQVHLADLRMRVLNNEPISAEEYRDLLMDLRRGRDMAAAATRAATARAAKAKRADKAKTPTDIHTLFSGGKGDASPV